MGDNKALKNLLRLVQQSEVRWVLYCVKHNFSDASQEDFVPTVQAMLPFYIYLEIYKYGECFSQWK